MIEDIDAAWIEHHFAWIRAEGSSDRLERRAAFETLPRRGRLTVDPNDSYREYRIQPVSDAMQEIVVAFLEESMGGERQPRGQYSSSDEVVVRGKVLHVMYSGDHVGLWMDRGTDTTFVEELARAIDAQLAAGRWHEHFLP